MGCGGSTHPRVMRREDYPAPVAFEVPLEEGEESLVKKHPPKRLQRLEDQQSPNITAKDIESKLAEAEQRRLQILNQRIQSAKAAVKAVKKPSKPEE
ncbi:unnamed protein product [Bemisia tabaci]|uniref:Uncharacterized protein n=1 Tax=Bemisia tabaci TaxID=7038 RepID=A0A9P0CDI1_BEMTA|nr:PREDICTED: uncharacterized protein C14orf105 [Bemisia tabaci]CAH0767651.1 unnamed protein product [Bemisia tabaci]